VAKVIRKKLISFHNTDDYVQKFTIYGYFTHIFDSYIGGKPSVWALCADQLTGVVQKLQWQRIHLSCSFLLHPVPRAFKQMYAKHLRADIMLHALESARALVNAPVGGTGDVAGWYSHMSPVEHPQLVHLRDAPFYMSFAPQMNLRYYRIKDNILTRRDGALLPPHA